LPFLRGKGLAGVVEAFVRTEERFQSICAEYAGEKTTETN
jgi:hypothetical protein